MSHVLHTLFDMSYVLHTCNTVSTSDKMICYMCRIHVMMCQHLYATHVTREDMHEETGNTTQRVFLGMRVCVCVCERACGRPVDTTPSEPS